MRWPRDYVRSQSFPPWRHLLPAYPTCLMFAIAAGKLPQAYLDIRVPTPSFHMLCWRLAKTTPAQAALSQAQEVVETERERERTRTSTQSSARQAGWLASRCWAQSAANERESCCCLYDVNNLRANPSSCVRCTCLLHHRYQAVCASLKTAQVRSLLKGQPVFINFSPDLIELASKSSLTVC